MRRLSSDSMGRKVGHRLADNGGALSLPFEAGRLREREAPIALEHTSDGSDNAPPLSVGHRTP
jgi:hypothetical protein